MNCLSCHERYALHTFNCYPNGLHSEGFRWVLKERYERAQMLLRESDALKNRALEVARQRYLSGFLKRFDGASKKTVWTSLLLAIPYYKSLGTFYQHTKGCAQAEYLQQEFSHHTFVVVSKILGVQDKELEDLQRESRGLSDQAETLLSSGT